MKTVYYIQHKRRDEQIKKRRNKKQTENIQFEEKNKLKKTAESGTKM